MSLLWPGVFDGQGKDLVKKNTQMKQAHGI